MGIFHTVWTGDLGEGFNSPGLKGLTGRIGYVTAPLFFNTPTRSPRFKTWFSITEARKQPAPKGLLFIHGGGPAPSLEKGLFGFQFFSEDLQNTLLDEYDVVSVDQRGMGMSAIELLYDIDAETFEEFSKAPIFQAPMDFTRFSEAFQGDLIKPKVLGP